VNAYTFHYDPVTYAPYVANPNPVSLPGYVGFDPDQPAINHGEGFAKNIGGNQLPNAPHYTVSLTADYTTPLSDEWAGTLHGDLYWQSDSFARVFNDRPYDEIRGYHTINMALIFSNQDGWQAMAYVKNILDVTHITGAFLSSDDTGLATNIFVTDPRLFGIRITKNW
jgi:outer membrane receptor protein involved in Fe transport